MLQEMIDKKIFNQAKEYAFDYADKALERNVFPTAEAIESLNVFDEELPINKGNSYEIIELLHKYGSPATVTQIGGRYFGLVNGGVIPTTLAVKWLNDFWDQNTPLFVTSLSLLFKSFRSSTFFITTKLPPEFLAAFSAFLSDAFKFLSGLAGETKILMVF